MKEELYQLIKRQEDVLVLMKKLGIERTELSIEDNRWAIKHWMEKLE